MQHICLRHSLMFVYTGRRRNKDLLLFIIIIITLDHVSRGGMLVNILKLKHSFKSFR